MFENLPPELKVLPQWCIAGSDRSPINPKTGKAARVNDPNTWGTFEDAAKWGKPLGFIFAKTDPFVVIDLDDKEYDPCPPEEKEVHKKIVTSFASYAEISTSGRGYHIIARGKLPGGGRHRGRVEIYDSGRFMILTGNVIWNKPIVENQSMIDALISEMPEVVLSELDESGKELLTDDELFDMAIGAENGAKFEALTNGDTTGYSSQSEADLALLSILAFYSASNPQVRRIFRASPLGKRDKAIRDDRYLDYSLRRVRGEKEETIDFSKIQLPKTPEKPKKSKEKQEGAVILPPGFAGEIARYFLSVSIRPVQEISIAATIGLLAGLTGRAYNISGAGLNQYILLLAKTGTGKEGMQSSIDKLLAEVRQTVPIIDDFIGPAAFASGPALVKTLAKKPCVVSILGEFGLVLQSITDKHNVLSGMFRKVLLDVYGKSGANQTLRASVYSDSDKSTAAVHSPSLTLLGESTPETFYEGVSQSNISEGLIPRFLVIHYSGLRPPSNKSPNQSVPEGLARRLIELVAASTGLQNSFDVVNVSQSMEAANLLDALNEEADAKINNAKMDTEAQLWNRAHLKALKLGALLAVADNPHQPIISEEQAIWAINLVKKDLNIMSAKFTSGDVGQGDSKQIADLRRALDGYFTADEKMLSESYALPVGLRQKGLIPYLYFQRRTANLASFRGDRQGATTALKRSLESLLASGELQELPRSQGASLGFTGRIFAIPKP
jgi:hypothetical protein